MTRSKSTIGAALVLLGLAAGPARADAPDPVQNSTRSVGVVQVGSVDVRIPVRVASHGDDGARGPAARGDGGPRTADSAGAAQVGPVRAHVPVRVLSDGDDAGRGPAARGHGGQRTADSALVGQVAPVDADAPVRVASDGDDTAGDAPPDGSTPDGSTPDGGQEASDSIGGLQLASVLVTAPLRALSAETAGDGGPGVAETASLARRESLDEAGEAPDVTVEADVPAGDGGAGAVVPAARLVAARLVRASAMPSLPLTGASAWVLGVAGGWLLASGLALLLATAVLRAPGRADGARGSTRRRHVP
jgi:hypothetical protein